MGPQKKRPDPEPKPSLRLSHILYGRRSPGNRVEYLVDDESFGKLHGHEDSARLVESLLTLRPPAPADFNDQ
jgi:hypothetical protein